MVKSRLLRATLFGTGFLLLLLAPLMLGSAVIWHRAVHAWIGLSLGASGCLLLWTVGAPWWEVWGSLGGLMLFWGALGLCAVVLDGLSIRRVGLGSSRYATVWILTTLAGLGLWRLARSLKPAPAPAPPEPPLPIPTGPAILHENGQWWALRGEERLGPFEEPEEAEAALAAPTATPSWNPVPEMRLLFDMGGNLTPEMHEWKDDPRLNVDSADLVPVWYPWEDEDGNELVEVRRALYFRNDLRAMLGLPSVVPGQPSEINAFTPERLRRALFSVHSLRTV